ncbi:MAG: tRNA dihydrouridine synthase DusB [Bacteroidales bacterium]|nr:tRNA dihydrouridine synthase DusB [Bacteroidales bacterium]
MVKIADIEVGEFPLILSPMDDITDLPFRKLCKPYGVDVLITEFIAADGIIREADKSHKKMTFDAMERPIAVQIFGHDLSSLLQSLEFVEAVQPDFIDINWGCPVKKVAGRGAGSGILKDVPKMIAITEAIVKASKLPITVKTRIGYEETNKPIVELAERLQDVGVKAISIHGRTKTQMYKGSADWTLIGKVKENPRMTIPVFGNGDITSAEIAVEMKNRYGVDGILIGRASIGNPWIFEQTKRLLNGLAEREITISERVEVCKKHLMAAIEWKGERTAIMEMRKHYGGYFKGIQDFKQFRIPLVTYSTLDELLPIFDAVEEYYSR